MWAMVCRGTAQDAKCGKSKDLTHLYPFLVLPDQDRRIRLSHLQLVSPTVASTRSSRCRLRHPSASAENSPNTASFQRSRHPATLRRPFLALALYFRNCLRQVPHFPLQHLFSDNLVKLTHAVVFQRLRPAGKFRSALLSQEGGACRLPQVSEWWKQVRDDRCVALFGGSRSTYG